MSDVISRQVAISAICSACGKIDCDKMDKCEKLQLPPANNSEIPNSSDTISRQAAIDALSELATFTDEYSEYTCMYTDDVYKTIKQLPPAQPVIVPCDYAKACNKVSMNRITSAVVYMEILEDFKKYGYVLVDMSENMPPANNSEIPNSSDTISRQAAIDALDKRFDSIPMNQTTEILLLRKDLRDLPSAQRTCVNCGRTVNNGGWYADGRTRCPIEEHYALPKDGYCHLWEKRNVTDDDYPERQKNEQV